MLVSYELQAAAGPKYAKPRCWAASLLNSLTVWLPVCLLLCYTPFCTTARPAGLALCNRSKSGVVHTYGFAPFCKRNGRTLCAQVSSILQARPGSSAVAQLRIFTSGLVQRPQTRHQLPFVQFTKCAHFHYEETWHLRIHSFQTPHAEECQQVKTKNL